LNGTVYGSWAEYGIVAAGKVTGAASASGFAGGVASENLCSSLSLLTFENSKNASSPTCDANTLGHYSSGTTSPLDALIARFATTKGAPNQTGEVDIKDLASKTVYPGSGTITLKSTGDIPKGKWIVINAPNATVRITQNIHYTNTTLTSVSDIPQVVIIAKNIVIADTVTNVDAWLIAKSSTSSDGVVNTCDATGVDEPRQLTAKVCDKLLTVNGPVIANHLKLYRTGGTGNTAATAGDPAEVFNLRPDAYLWASNFSSQTPKARTVLTHELPPRF